MCRLLQVCSCGYRSRRSDVSDVGERISPSELLQVGRSPPAVRSQYAAELAAARGNQHTQRSHQPFPRGTNAACRDKRQDGLVRIEKPGYTGPGTDQISTAAAAATATDEVADGDDSIQSGDAAADTGPLPLSA